MNDKCHISFVHPTRLELVKVNFRKPYFTAWCSILLLVVATKLLRRYTLNFLKDDHNEIEAALWACISQEGERWKVSICHGQNSLENDIQEKSHQVCGRRVTRSGHFEAIWAF